MNFVERGGKDHKTRARRDECGLIMAELLKMVDATLNVLAVTVIYSDNHNVCVWHTPWQEAGFPVDAMLVDVPLPVRAELVAQMMRKAEVLATAEVMHLIITGAWHSEPIISLEATRKHKMALDPSVPKGAWLN